ncbi:amidohydrolase family protein [Vibrio parahaemolyticus]|uniref:amidohydrolase family protein n=1 Tax=Vibrio parahaemolyticus TaxID=670 RepID=UPI0003FC3E83|nr:amidohydrolase family protein [Vibrio parahaemolyticus]
MELKEIQTMPKGELHVHLNGLANTALLRSLLQASVNKLPSDFDLYHDLTRQTPASSLSEYLKPWQALRLVPQSRSDLSKIVDSAFFELKNDNVEFVELRNSVIYISLLNNITVQEALEWLLQDIEECSSRYNIKAGLLLTITRGEYAPEHLRALVDAYKSLGRPQSVIGLDLAGNEDVSPPPETAYLFRTAKDEEGLSITIHAGETGKSQNIEDAIINYSADRIGHGTAIVQAPRLIELVKKKDICIEVCPVSNRLTNSVAENESHPVREMVKHEVPFVVCSDNPSIHGSTLSDDYFELYKETNNALLIQNMLSTQKKYSFIKGIE